MQSETGTRSSAEGVGHLTYYETHQISPVRYTGSQNEHFDRRDALYRSLGLPPVVFRGARVLEVAAGSGQNSLYVASCRPASLDLVEPNAAGRQHIEACYRDFQGPHTKPLIHPKRFQEFEATAPYDIVICESWLGCLPSEVELIRKLATLVAPGGVLLLTVVPLSGFFPNVMRKLLALRLLRPGDSFEEQTQQMVDAFGPHLATMQSMTRSHEDWVHDCMINPHYLNVALPLDLVLKTVGSDLEMLATFPRFDTDWRWFKGLTGAARDFNRHFLDSYRANVHNFIDYRKTFPALDPNAVAPLDEAFAELHRSALDYQDRIGRGAADGDRVSATLARIAAELGRHVPDFAGPLEQLKSAWSRAELRAADVRDMTLFGPLFGRETVYVSMTRPRA